MKIVLTGVSGLLGGELWKVLSSEHEVWCVGRKIPHFIPESRFIFLELSDFQSTYREITKINPEIVIHLASFSNVDGCEKDPDRAFRDNSLATRNLVIACQRFDTSLLFVSTDYVFDGLKPKGRTYREYDPVNPLSVYAHSKVWGEMFVRDHLAKFYIVRCSFLFGPGRLTFIDHIVEKARQGKPIVAVTDMVTIPTYTPDLAKAIHQLIKTSLYGVYHITNSNYCSRFEFARFLVKKIPSKKGFRIIKKTQKQLGLPAKRPQFSTLDNLHWRLNGFQPLRPWQEALDEYLKSVYP